MIKTRTWIMIIAALFAVSAVSAALLFFMPKKGSIANIYVNGECVRSIDLSAVTEAYEFTVETEWGSNTVRVEPGRICVKDADCRDRVCVNSGWISDTAAPLVCLPHKLVIKIESKENSEIDAVSK